MSWESYLKQLAGVLLIFDSEIPFPPVSAWELRVFQVLFFFLVKVETCFHEANCEMFADS